jgi:formylglycine-generating enzyme required for sulfatase activity
LQQRLKVLEQQVKNKQSEPKVAIVAPPVAPAVPDVTKPKPTVGVFPQSTIKVTPLSAERERALKPKDTFKECDLCPEMVVIPAGSFMMGSPESEKGTKHEGPQHWVAFSRQFAVGKFAITFDEWDACVRDNGCNGYRPRDEGWGRGKLPVVNISWNDARAYVVWLSKRTGKTYRLPSEAEREYVTRGGTATAFWFGTTISSQQANFNGNLTYGDGSRGEYRQKTVAVDSFQANPFSLYQVHGNVWEWTEDCYVDSYKGAPTDGSAWTRRDCTDRVLRGGAWSLDPWYLRSAFRNWGSADFRFYSNGFRVARTLNENAP